MNNRNLWKFAVKLGYVPTQQEIEENQKEMDDFLNSELMVITHDQRNQMMIANMNKLLKEKTNE